MIIEINYEKYNSKFSVFLCLYIKICVHKNMPRMKRTEVIGNVPNGNQRDTEEKDRIESNSKSLTLRRSLLRRPRRRRKALDEEVVHCRAATGGKMFNNIIQSFMVLSVQCLIGAMIGGIVIGGMHQIIWHAIVKVYNRFEMDSNLQIFLGFDFLQKMPEV